jgi:hypothetical protein
MFGLDIQNRNSNMTKLQEYIKNPATGLMTPLGGAGGSSASLFAEFLKPITLPGGFAYEEIYVVSPQEWNVAGSGLGHSIVMSYDSAHALVSPDGSKAWHPIDTGLTNMIPSKIASGNGKMVVVGRHVDSGTAMVGVSSDVTSWQLIDLSQSNPDISGLSSVAFGAGKFIAVGHEVMVTSTDGETWTDANMSRSWAEIFYNNGTFFIIGDGNSHISSDGENWTQVSSSNLFSVPFVAYGNGLYVMVQANSTDGRTSFDGINWSGWSIPPNIWNDIAFGNGRFVAVSKGDMGFGTSAAMTTTDGVHWTELDVPSNNYGAVIFRDGMFYLFGSHDSIVTTGSPTGEVSLPQAVQWIVNKLED